MNKNTSIQRYHYIHVRYVISVADDIVVLSVCICACVWPREMPETYDMIMGAGLFHCTTLDFAVVFHGKGCPYSAPARPIYDGRIYWNGERNICISVLQISIGVEAFAHNAVRESVTRSKWLDCLSKDWKKKPQILAIEQTNFCFFDETLDSFTIELYPGLWSFSLSMLFDRSIVFVVVVVVGVWCAWFNRLKFNRSHHFIRWHVN